MSCSYTRNDGTPCRCGELAPDGGHYDCVGPSGEGRSATGPAGPVEGTETVIGHFQVRGHEPEDLGEAPGDPVEPTSGESVQLRLERHPWGHMRLNEETAGAMLERLGMDGELWAKEFAARARTLGYSDMDEGWLMAWFANAIMAGYDAAERKAEARIVTIAAHAPKTLTQIENAALLEALEATQGNMSAAARRLDIDRRTLYRRVGSYKKFVLKAGNDTPGNSDQE